MNKIKPCLWFNDNAESAAQFYTSLFEGSSIKLVTKYSDESSKASGRPKGSVMTVLFELAGQEFLGLNGGPVYEITPAVSMFVACESDAEIEKLFAKLSSGKVLMPLQEYPFAKKYAWVQDEFGLSWQLMFAEREQKITPCLLFTGANKGKAGEAMKLYTSVFPDSEIDFAAEFPAGEGYDGLLARGEFTLNGFTMAASDSPIEHEFGLTPGVSFIVNCDTQQEIDKYWNLLVAGGGREEQCGWLSDKYGVAWQIVPQALEEILKSDDVAKAHRATAALMKMVKIDIAALQNA
jgi:predicted 3-demethylubiquinone-9 3-methyltransferase (glyoxalase superfamily)